MSANRKVEFCGAFNGTVTLRKGETVEQLYERLQDAIQTALDRSCKRLDCAVGVDMGDLANAYDITTEPAKRNPIYRDPTA